MIDPVFSPGYTMDEEGIAWESDVDHRFAQPTGFKMEPRVPPTTDCDGLLGEVGSVGVFYTPKDGRKST